MILRILRTLYPVMRVYMGFTVLSALISVRLAGVMAVCSVVCLIVLVAAGCVLQLKRDRQRAAPDPETIVPAGFTFEVRCLVCGAAVFSRPLPYTGKPSVPEGVYLDMANEALHDHQLKNWECVTLRLAVPVFIEPRPC